MTAASRTSMDPSIESAPSGRAARSRDTGTLDLFAPTHEVEVRAHLRTVPGRAPATGAERRDAALEAMSEKDAVRLALDYVREQLITLYKSRQHWMPQDKRWVTSDDADKLLREWPRYPTELLGRPNHWRGSLFKSKGWVLSGHSVPSKREHMNATTLPGWKWEGE